MIRPTQDNVIVALEPLPEMSETGAIHLPQRSQSDRRQARIAVVLASGPGYYKRINLREARETNGLAEEQYVFVPNETKPGDRVLIDALAGQDYNLDLDVPRHNKGADFLELLGERREFRIVRESGEIHGVLEP